LLPRYRSLGNDGPPVQNLTITDNVLEANLGPAANGGGSVGSLASIQIVTTNNQGFAFGSVPTNSGITIKNNYIADSGRSGIWVGETNSGTLQNNLVIRWNQQSQLGILGISPPQAQVLQDFAVAVVTQSDSSVAETSDTISETSVIAAPVTMTPPIATVAAPQSSGSFQLATAVDGFAWRTSSDSAWLTVAPGSDGGSGNSTLQYSVAANTTNALRTGHITIAGEVFTVTQTTSQTQAPPIVVASATAGQVEPFAPDSIVSAYGSNLAVNTASATLPLGTSLGGTSVTVTDAAGIAREALLFYVSQAQINFEIPDGTAAGVAQVAVTGTNNATGNTTIQIGSVSPGLFDLNSGGLLAALVIPVIDGVQQDPQAVYQLNGSSVVPLPISLSSSNTQVFLEMYGTGIRNAQMVTVTVGGIPVPVLYSGAAPGYAGEDQVNAGPLPASLAGSGAVNVWLVADGQAANPVNLTIQ
jgi:uncharacterized protein (TIGR03437 family)